MKVDIIIILAKHGYPPVPPEIYEKVYNDILEQAENFKKYSDWYEENNKLPQSYDDLSINRYTDLIYEHVYNRYLTITG